MAKYPYQVLVSVVDAQSGASLGLLTKHIGAGEHRFSVIDGVPQYVDEEVGQLDYTDQPSEWEEW